MRPGDGPTGFFINYRREDELAVAVLLRDALNSTFPGVPVYVDVDQEPGVDWEARLRERGAQARVFLALIGRRWLDTLRGRSGLSRTTSAPDYVRCEIEWALRDWPGAVVPVLVDGAQMPAPEALPRSIRGITRRNAVEIRTASVADDVRALAPKLAEAAVNDERGRLREGALVPDTAPGDHGDPLDGDGAGVPAPRDDHYDGVIAEMVEGRVVPWLGSCVRGSLPDSRELATSLAGRHPDLYPTFDLAEIAQQIVTRKGARRLRDDLGDLIDGHSEPTALHRFLAALPGQLRRNGLTPGYQLIVTTNYDRALESAFEAIDEPFDYAVYAASTGRFIHIPWGERDAEPVSVGISEPAGYTQFPIGDDLALARTVIVKLCGAPAAENGHARWSDDCVITEDQYIDYLPAEEVGELLPAQLLETLANNSCLFLGYALREWSARVLVRRLWSSRPITENGWAVENRPDELERDLWRTISRVQLYDASPSEYVQGLAVALARKLGLASDGG